ncbi:MAG: hypothetical protein RIQ56_717 [Candidatus Parcubacteria bacterium]|jgi:hypothetical protein
MNKTILSILAILVAAGVLYMTFAKKAEAPQPDELQSAQASTTTDMPLQLTGKDQEIEGDGYTLKVEKKPGVVAPSLTSPVAYTKTLTAEEKKVLEGHIAKQRDVVSKNLSDVSAWLNLGVLYKMAGDYVAARDVWAYLNQVAPQQSLSFHNLADLYAFYLKDYPKAEKNYLQAIAIDPSRVAEYMALHELYRDLYPMSASAAEDILLKGISNNPDSIDLILALARYYAARAREVDAKNQYELAIKKAESENLPAETIQQIKSEAGL